MSRAEASSPVVSAVVAAARSYSVHKAGLLAAGVAYYGVFSLFPLLLVFTTVASFVLEAHPDLQEDLTTSALSDFPIIGDEIRRNVGNIDGSGVALAFGLVVALWAGLGAMQALQDALLSIWHVQPRAAVSSRFRSLVGVCILAVGVVATTATRVAIAWIDGGPARTALGFLSAAAVSILTVLVVYHVLTGVSGLAWRFHAPGALLTGAATALLQTVGVVLLERQLRGASALYGLFGLFIGLLWWVYLQAQVTLFGAVLNTVLHRRRTSEEQVEPSLVHGVAKVE